MSTWPSSRVFFLRGLGRACIVVLALAALAAPTALVRGARADCSTGHSAVDVELSFTTGRSAEALAGCSQGDVHTALLQDVLLAVYSGVVLALGAGFVAGKLPRGAPGGYRIRRLRAAGGTLAGVAVGAGALDVVANASLAVGLQGPDGALSVGEPWVRVAAIAGWTAFVLAAVVLAYVVVGLIGWIAMPSRTMLEAAPYVPPTGPDPEPGQAGDIGISLSGGGVRAASFGLGALQALDASGVYAKARWLSAVSGGSYMAGAWTIARRDPVDAGAPPPWSAPDSPEVPFLRSNLRYLLRRDGGLGGAVATLVVGLAVNVATLGALLWIVARPLGWLIGSWVVTDAASSGGPVEYVFAPRYWVPPVAWAVIAAVLVLTWVMLQRVSSLSLPGNTHRVRRAVWLAALASGAAAALLAFVLIAAPAAAAWVPSVVSDHKRLVRWVEAAIGGGALVAIVRVVRKPLGRIAPRLGGLLLVALTVVVGSQIAGAAAEQGAGDGVVAWLVVLGVFALWYYAADPDWWSIQPFYRARLRSAYATRRVAAAGDPGAVTVQAYGSGDEPDLATYLGVSPELMVCTTLNVSGDGLRTRVGIPAYSFTFTPSSIRFHVPGATDGECDDYAVSTEQYARVFRRWDTPPLTVMTAVGLSGAAVAPAMGRHNMGSTNALLAFANIRLGMWMPNPRYVGTSDELPARPGYPRRRIGYLLKEMAQVYDPDDLYVYVTDGGHWENLGVVELIRRRCDEIYCVDAAGGTADRFATAAEAITLAAQECGADVTIELAGLRSTLDAAGVAAPVDRDCTFGVITYSGSDGQPTRQGILWYLRASLTNDAPARVWAYREKNAIFPADPTSNQFFDAEKFECYRQLGEHAATHVGQLRDNLVRLARGQDQLPHTYHATAAEVELIGQLRDPRCRDILGLGR